MFICENCNKEHDGSYGSGRFCEIKCSRSFSTKNKRIEINRKVSKKLRSNIPWNKGKIISKTIEKKCPVCKKSFFVYKNRIKQLCCSKKCRLIGMKLNDIYNKNNYNWGGYRKGSGRSKGSYYNNSYFDSFLEIEIAKYLEKNNIKWIRNTKRFYYTWNNNKHYYVPDFYLPDYKLYLEVKGYWYKDKKERTLKAVKDNNINWILLMQKNEWEINKDILLKKILKYG